jgi:hypothetical protein
MSITRLQQARQMYAMGQRVAKTMDGSRPGYRGDAGYRSGSEQASSIGQGNVGSQASFGGGKGHDSSGRSEGASGADRSAVGPGSTQQKNIDLLNAFKETRPKVNIPNFGLSGMFLNLFNKGVNSPIQKFADFTASKNRPFFENVIRGGKIPGLNFGTVSNMTPEQLEASYKSYMDNRMSGATDAYGNPLNNRDDDRGIATLYNYDMFDDTEENANDPFVSRFLQNQPDDIREGIEASMQNYYTV